MTAKRFKKSENGQVAVEYALTLLFLFFFLIVFFEIVYIVITHERVSLSNFAFSRLYSVHRTAEANTALKTVDPRVNVTVAGASSQTVSITCKKDIRIPINLYNIFQKSGVSYRVVKQREAFMEPHLGGDN